MAEPVDAFISYSHRDEALRHSLEKHLASLLREGFVRVWHDRRITAGDDWGGEIDRHLEEARLVLLLISPDFIASKYCFDVETARAVERHLSGEAVVVPVILRPVDWINVRVGPFNTKLSELHALPVDGLPVTKWPDQDEAFVSIVQGLRSLIEKMPGQSGLAGFQPQTNRAGQQRVDLPVQPKPRALQRSRIVVLATTLVLIALGASMWISNLTGDDAQSAQGRGYELFGRAMYAEAVEAYSEAIRLGANSPAVYKERGAANLYLAQYSEAISDLNESVRRRGVSFSPEDVESHLLLGLAFLGQRRDVDASKQFQRVTELDTSGEFGRCSKATLLWLQGQTLIDGVGKECPKDFNTTFGEVTLGQQRR